MSVMDILGKVRNVAQGSYNLILGKVTGQKPAEIQKKTQDLMVPYSTVAGGALGSILAGPGTGTLLGAGLGYGAGAIEYAKEKQPKLYKSSLDFATESASTYGKSFLSNPAETTLLTGAGVLALFGAFKGVSKVAPALGAYFGAEHGRDQSFLDNPTNIIGLPKDNQGMITPNTPESPLSPDPIKQVPTAITNPDPASLSPEAVTSGVPVPGSSGTNSRRKKRRSKPLAQPRISIKNIAIAQIRR